MKLGLILFLRFKIGSYDLDSYHLEVNLYKTINTLKDKLNLNLDRNNNYWFSMALI